MAFSLTFVETFFKGMYYGSPLFVVLCALIIVLGQIVGKIEKWGKFDSVYWAFITALTVGYGDIRPSQKHTKLISILIALIGIMMTGIFVAITVAAASQAYKKHILFSMV
jgi:voltage-gated potassium channel